MNFKDEFLKELMKRINENVDIIQSSFELSDKVLVKSQLYNIEPVEFHLPILIEDNPYLFLSKLIYSIINKQRIKVSNTNIACELILELVNLVLNEFDVEGIEKL